MNLFKVKPLLRFKVILITFKTIHGFAPKYISVLISVKSESNYSLRSNYVKLLLSPPVVKTLSTLGDRAFLAAAPKLWNQLPSEIRRISSIDYFKRALKTYLLNKLFIIVQSYNIFLIFNPSFILSIFYLL